MDRSAFYRPQTRRFADTFSRIDVALQVLNHIWWSAERSNPRQQSAPKLLPLAFMHNYLDKKGDERGWSKRETACVRYRVEGAAVRVLTGVTVIDQI